MSLNENQITFLESIKKDCVHASNILAKANKGDENIHNFFDKYKEFYRASLSDNLTEAVKALNQYKKFVKEENRYSAQSKFEPTIIEEFVCQILRQGFGNGVLMYGSVKAYSSLYISYSSTDSFKKGVAIKTNVKDQDVCIYKCEKLTKENGEQIDVFIPIVCVECKTYLDKTMYEGSVATADKIKVGNPHCLYFLVTERYEVSGEVDIETSNIDNIYVIRKQRRRSNPTNPIYSDVFEHLLKQIEQKLHMRKLPVNEMIEKYGYIKQVATHLKTDGAEHAK